MFKRFAALAALVVVCAGCVTMITEKTRGKYLRENPGLSYEVKRAIMAGDIVIGMTEMDVVASIGSPYDINRTTAAYGTSAQFVYASAAMYPAKPKYSYVYFENGKVTSWQQ